MIRLTLALCILLAACTQAPPPNAGPQTPGYTGTTVIPGNNSSLAGNAEATYLQQKWGSAPRI
ncbi:MAG TPA: hypothetical protein VHB27_09315 [Rhodopila sp.]|uniref:hypothetical protein n=1 Tax=Rhodopila sp. TaxID=2480087 RepID=UPI002C8E54AE|nr:hypothetical protein [Rhodopila sp.]HVY15416.1 hypothetical protein [Rhodopila sp.]